MTKKIFDGNSLLGRGNIILEIDDNGNIYTPGAFNTRDYVGRVDDRGYVYKGMSTFETYVGRVDKNGNLFKSSALGGDYVGNISKNGILRDRTPFGGDPTDTVGFGLTTTLTESSTPVESYDNFLRDESLDSYSDTPPYYIPPKYRNKPPLFDFLFEITEGWFFTSILIGIVVGIYGAYYLNQGAPILVGLIVSFYIFPRIFFYSIFPILLLAFIYYLKKYKSSNHQ